MVNYPSNQLTMCIADMPVTLLLEDCDEAMRQRIHTWYAAFIVPTRQDVLSIRVIIEPGAEFIPMENYRYWQIRTSIQDERINFESHREKGWVDRGLGLGQVILRPKGDIENFLRVLYAWLCIDHDSLLVHSSGIIRDGRGYMFFGPSGNGKTTTTRLSTPYTILSDDMVIVKKIKEKFHAFGVPFRGTLPEAPRTNASAELSGIYALTKDARHFLMPLSLPEATARLVQCIPFVMAQSSVAGHVADICADLAANVPVQMLHFRKDNGFWAIIK